VATTIFADFLNGWTTEERGKFYAQFQPKGSGRPVGRSKKRNGVKTPSGAKAEVVA
jgi:hypothetical protein